MKDKINECAVDFFSKFGACVISSVMQFASWQNMICVFYGLWFYEVYVMPLPIRLISRLWDAEIDSCRLTKNLQKCPTSLVGYTHDFI